MIMTVSFLALILTVLPMPAGLMTDLVEHTEWPENARPLIRSEHPSFSWAIESDVPDITQKAYRLLVASRPELLRAGSADIWDSGTVKDGARSGIVCGGRALAAGADYYWTVKVKTEKGWSAYAPPKKFHTADVLDGEPAYYPLARTPERPVLQKRNASGNIYADFGKSAFGQFTFSTDVSEPCELTVHFGEASDSEAVRRNPGGSIRYCAIKTTVLPGCETEVIFPHDARNTDPGANESGVSPILMPEETGEVYPFRYVEIEGLPEGAEITEATRLAVHYPFNDDASFFRSSDETLNAVWDLCKYSIKATSFCGYYVDGDRERIPYEADAYINQLGHYSVDREFSMARRTVNHLMMNPTWPTEWILESVLLCWMDYMYTGDKALLEKWYELIKARNLLALKRENGLISTREKPLDREFCASIGFRGRNMRDIVDWPQSGAAGLEKESPGEADGFVLTKYNAAVNALWCHVLEVTADIAAVLGKGDDERAFRSEADAAAKAFNELFYDAGTGCYKDGIDTEHKSLHAGMYALAFGIIPEDRIRSEAEFMKSRGMACSVYGAQFLLDAMYEAGEAGYASSLMTSRTLRSWYNMIALGSTITLEAWDPAFKPNLDWNHAWGAAPANIIPRKMMGLEPLVPGFLKMRIKPQLGLVKNAEAVIPTIAGPVRINCSQEEGFSLELEIPAGTSAEVWIPTGNGGWKTVTVGSGRHRLVDPHWHPDDLQEGYRESGGN